MKKPKTPGLVTVAISTTITIIFWVFIALYQVLTSKPDPVVDPQLLEQIDPNLDVTLLDTLDQKIYFAEGEEGPPLVSDFENINSQNIPSEEVAEVPEETEDIPEDEEVPTATVEGELDI